MIVTIEALDAWWPPTLSPLGLGRTRLAWCTIAVASHSTRCSTARRTAMPGRRRLRCWSSTPPSSVMLIGNCTPSRGLHNRSVVSLSRLLELRTPHRGRVGTVPGSAASSTARTPGCCARSPRARERRCSRWRRRPGSPATPCRPGSPGSRRAACWARSSAGSTRRRSGYPLAAFVHGAGDAAKARRRRRALTAVPEVRGGARDCPGRSTCWCRSSPATPTTCTAIAGALLAIDGVERTSTSLVMRRLVDHRLDPLLRRLAEDR